MSEVTCPDWCNQTTEDHACDGSHLRLDHSSARVASGSSFPEIDERGAIFPAVSVGINEAHREGRGTNIFLWLTGPRWGDGEEVAFPLEEAFGLAVDILDNYRMVIQEIDRPAPPYRDIHDIRPILETIEHNLGWYHREKAAGEPKRRRQVTMSFIASDTECDAAMKAVERAVLPIVDANISVESSLSPITAEQVGE